MDETLQELIYKVCSEFPTLDVEVCNIFDQRRFARMTHYAWKNGIGFHPDMFKNALKHSNLFQGLCEEELDEKSSQLCHQADFAKNMLHATFDLEHLTI